MPTQHRPPSGSRGGEAGFSVVEATIALGLVFTILVGMLATVATSVRGVVSSRQRTQAVGLAKQVLEQARGLSYAEVGHDLDDDATLASDPALASIGVNRWTYGGEELAGSSLDWPGRDPSLPAPFYPHQRTETVDGRSYAVSSYVTLVDPAAAVPPRPGAVHKRMTVVVAWEAAQHGDATVSEVRLDSLLFAASQPPDPLLQGVSDVDAGVLSVTGFVANLDLDDAFLWFPYSRGEVDSRFIRRVSGFASGARSQLNLSKALSTDDLSGCEVSNGVKTAECRGVKATTVADNDLGTAPATHDHDGPVSGAGGTIERKNVFAVVLGNGGPGVVSTAESRSTALACGAPCPPPDSAYSFAESDGLPYHESEADGPSAFSVPFDVGAVDLDAATASAPASTRSVVDRDDTVSGGTLTSTGTMSHPSVVVLPIDDPVYDLLGITLLPFNGMAVIGPTSVQATASAGPGVAAPSLTGASVAVSLFDTCNQLLPGYVNHTFTPGVAQTRTSCAELKVQGNTVRMDTTVTSAPAVVKVDVSGGTYRFAEISLTSWLRVVTRITVTESDGDVIADAVVDLDYGRLLARARYEPS